MPTGWNQFFVFAVGFSLLTGLSACDPEPMDQDPETPAYGNGIYIVNEGPFISGTGSVTYFDPIADTLTQMVYQKANDGEVPGNVLQSLFFHDNNVALVVNNANKLLIADGETFERKGLIEGFELPRYYLGVSTSKAYVSQWGATGTDGSIAVVDLASGGIDRLIETGQGTERMLLLDDRVFVVNEGGFGRDSVVSVINPASDEIVDEFIVGDNPTSILADADGVIWTLGRGYTANFSNPDDPANTDGKLCNFLPDGAGKFCMDVPRGATDLVIDPETGTLYFTADGQIWTYATDGSQTQPETFYPGYFYELFWDNDRKLLLAADAGDFASDGRILEINAAGEETGSFDAGIVPAFLISR
ncbi:MAG: hypothetical protein GYB31_10835 [Bacteroidetes bacterium]|nr:hypothetical protein [Bacteroidota bacterium]